MMATGYTVQLALSTGVTYIVSTAAWLASYTAVPPYQHQQR
jgi:hypothetical protein